jgi:hypothetical protein
MYNLMTKSCARPWVYGRFLIHMVSCGSEIQVLVDPVFGTGLISDLFHPGSMIQVQKGTVSRIWIRNSIFNLKIVTTRS